MIPHLQAAREPLCIATTASSSAVLEPAAAASQSPLGGMGMDASANDRATKRQKGEADDNSNHGTLSTSSSTHSSSTLSEESNLSSAGLVSSASQNVAAMIGKKYRRVTFAPVTSIHSTHWTREEVDQGWYTKDELAIFKQERKALVKTLKKVQFDLNRIDTNVHCLRGYEAYFSVQANKEYKLKRQMVWEAVLQEQARQRYMGRKDALMMQLVSGHATQWARDTATELGMRDAQVALQIFLEYIHEQQEDDDGELEDYDECDYDEDDDAPIALNWDEPLDASEAAVGTTTEQFDLVETEEGPLEDVSLHPEIDIATATATAAVDSQQQQQQHLQHQDSGMEPLQLSSLQLNRARLEAADNSNSNSQSSFATAASSMTSSSALSTTNVNCHSNFNNSYLQFNLQPSYPIATTTTTAKVTNPSSSVP